MKILEMKLIPGLYKIVNEEGEFIGSIDVDNILPQGLMSAMDEEAYNVTDEFMKGGNVAYLESVTIYDEHRCKGYGKKAINLLHDMLREDGYEYVVLTPVPSSKDTIGSSKREYWDVLNGLYKSLGYKVLSSFSFKSDYTDEMVVMVKDLTR